jgi:sulfate transport system permease protein
VGHRVITGVALVFLSLFLFVPLVSVFCRGLQKGLGRLPGRHHRGRCLVGGGLTLTAAVIAVPLNLVFGIAAAWAIAKFDFRGKSVLLTFIDLPFSVSHL